jgi:hypothetical protein
VCSISLRSLETQSSTSVSCIYIAEKYPRHSAKTGAHNRLFQAKLVLFGNAGAKIERLGGNVAGYCSPWLGEKMSPELAVEEA